MILITGNNEYAVKKQVDIYKAKYDDDFVYQLDQNTSDFIETLENILNSQSLFQANKLIVIDNNKFYKDKAILKKYKIDIETICQWLNESKYEIILILNEMQTAEKNFLKLLKITQKFDFNTYSEKDLDNWVLHQAKSYGLNIKYNDMLHLSSKLPKNQNIIDNELQKLSLLGEPINSELIDSFIPQYPIDDPFYFSNSLSNNNLYDIYKKYKLLLEQGEDINKLIYMITNTIILINRYYKYRKVILNRSDLANKLNITEKRLYVVEKIARNYQEQNINIMINELAALDEQIKFMGVSSNDLFETFLAKNFGK
ncbi:DNA polymerase III subunit delta [Mycoplasmopsis verecunda]|uniref:DNA-directed DNA polymerase n=1 Tax=Mycoplasmopsis verecunda TaxID=171291 RepID=A0A1T4KRF6_9BACT|nr:hypothetical protein [Mycoplasmopsis verecunda]WPB54689.1 hypothetical protein SAM46_00805 [Mycoplasmopsis verecunda]SJZ44950.1 DNA polymerase III, delta subunit [Mycoplasmopsis verecunda]